MRNLLLFAALLCVSLSFSQSKPFKISGKLIAEDDQSVLEAATVYLQRVKDSSLVTYTITDKTGVFNLEDESGDPSLNLYISYVGYKTYFQNIKLDKRDIDLETIPLEVNSGALDEVIITSTAPVTIKKDTLEFNVKSFKTKKNANVEDLLRELPGVEVDEEGKIKVNGKEVNQILVNGKPFFGNDPTITTKNLTKDIIEKIQVVDTKTKSEAFTGEAGDSESKTINLTIKKENNKGVFGRVSAGGGTDERYELAGMVNLFDNDRRVSILAGGNNTNSPGFSFGEISKMLGGGNSRSFNSNGSFSIDGRSFGGGQGITTSQIAGANYADKIGEKTDISGDYFYSSSNSENESSSERETILSDSRFFSNSSSRTVNDTDSHSANAEFEIKVDSTFLINVRPSFSFSTSKTGSSRNDDTFDSDRNLTNQSTVSSVVDTEAKQFSNNLSLTKRFGSDGAFLRFRMENSLRNNESEDLLNSDTEVFGTNPSTIIRDQLTDGENKNSGLKTGLTYSYPIIPKKLFLNVEYEYSRNKDENRQSTFDRDGTSQDFNVFNEALSTDFEYTDIESSPGARLRYRGEKFSARVGANYVFRTLKNQDLLRPEFNVERDFKAIEVSSNMNYRFSPKSSIYASYRLSNQPPALRQLQAFEDVSNPINTVVGNPNLEPSNRHSFYGGYNAYDWKNRTGFYVYSNITLVDNNVVSRTVIDPETLTRRTTYTNVNGNYNGSLGGDYSKNFKLDSIRKIRVRLGARTSMSRNINFNNDVKYASNVNTFSPSLGVEYIWDKVMEFRPSYRVSFTNNRYDIDAFEDRSFRNHNVRLRTATFLPKNFEWRNDINYNYNPDVAEGFQKSALFWNATVVYSFLKDKASLQLKVYDLLDQNTNARRVATQDFIEDSESTVLQRYFMFTFSWKFNSLGKKGEVRDRTFFYD